MGVDWTAWRRRGGLVVGLLLLGFSSGASAQASRLFRGVLLGPNGECVRENCGGSAERCESGLMCRSWSVQGSAGTMLTSVSVCAYAEGNVLCMANVRGCMEACRALRGSGSNWTGAPHPQESDACLCWPAGSLHGVDRSAFLCGLRADYGHTARCFQKPGSGGPVGYVQGDCDGDGVPNSQDACPCVSQSSDAALSPSRCGMRGCPPCPMSDGGAGADASVGDAGVPDAGGGTDGGSPDAAVVDAGERVDAAALEDGAIPDGGARPDAGGDVSASDAGRGRGAVGFQGGGGCACTMRARRGAVDGGVSWVFVLLGGLAWRRRQRR